MRRPRNVVIVAAAKDIHAVSVKHHVESLDVECAIVDLRLVSSGFVTAALDGPSPTVALRDSVMVDTGTTIWWRRPRLPAVNSEITIHEAQRFARAEWKACVHGAFGAVARAVINDPFAECRANHKVLQLLVAKAVGLAIPRTVVTNDWTTASEFYRANRRSGMRTIFKPLTPPMFLLGQARIITSLEDLRRGLRLAPIILQSCVERGIDLRVTIVGNELFAGAVAFDGDFEDWRVAADAAFRKQEIQPQLKRKLIELMRALGLATGSLDLRVSRDGTPYFLEVNPSGQFLFLELELNLPISARYAHLLVATPARCDLHGSLARALGHHGVA